MPNLTDLLPKPKDPTPEAKGLLAAEVIAVTDTHVRAAVPALSGRVIEIPLEHGAGASADAEVLVAFDEGGNEWVTGGVPLLSHFHLAKYGSETFIEADPEMNVLFGRNPSVYDFPTQPSRWAAITAAIVVDREGGDRGHFRSFSLASLDKVEIVLRSFGPNNNAPFGPFQDGTMLAGVGPGGGGRVGSWQGMPQLNPVNNGGNYGPHSARIAGGFTEPVRADNLLTTLAQELTLPDDDTVVVNGDVGALPGQDLTEQSWRQSWRVRIGQTSFATAGYEYDAGEDKTYLFGCTGGGVLNALLITTFPVADSNIRFRSRLPGSAGNAVRVRYLDPGAPDQDLSLDVSGTDITVNLATGATGQITTSGSDIIIAIRADRDVGELVEVSRKNVGRGTSAVQAMDWTNLAGGADSTTFPAGQIIRQVKNVAGGYIELLTTTLGDGDPQVRTKLHSDGVETHGRNTHENPTTTYEYLGGALRIKPMTTPIVDATVIGTPGTAAITYAVVARTPLGGVTLAGFKTITNAPNVLTRDNYVRVSWRPVPGAHAYDLSVYETDGTPSFEGLIAHQLPFTAEAYSHYGQGLASVNEVVTITLNGDPDGGDFTVFAYDGEESDPIVPFETAPSVEEKLEALTAFGANLQVEKVAENAWRVTFVGALAGVNVNGTLPALTVGRNSLTTESEDPDDPEEVPDTPTISIRTRTHGGPVTNVYGAGNPVPVRNTTADIRGEAIQADQFLELAELAADPPAADATHIRAYGKASGSRTLPYARDAVGILRFLTDLELGVANGVAQLDSGGLVPVAQLPANIQQFQGAYNATTNTPALVDGTGNSGDFYRVTVAGTHNFGSGAITFAVGDAVQYDGSIWFKVGHSDAVSSVNGFTGIVVLDAGDIATTPAGGLASADVQAALNELDTEKATAASAVMDGDTAGGVLDGTYPNPGFATDPPPPVNRQVFTADGTWTKPTAPSGFAAYTDVEVELIGGGSGGGAGRRGVASSDRAGGQGGNGGSWSRRVLPLAACGATETVDVGAGGAGGAAQTADSTAGANGGAGANSSFGSLAFAQGGTAPLGGSTVIPHATATSQSASRSLVPGQSGGNTGSPNGSAPSNAAGFSRGGGAGGSITAANTVGDGAAGGTNNVGGATAGTAGTGGAAGGAGSTAIANAIGGGGGGGGGGASIVAAAGAGGNGGAYGSAGGGGGASLNGNNSGAGGNGADGIVIVTCR